MYYMYSYLVYFSRFYLILVLYNLHTIHTYIYTYIYRGDSNYIPNTVTLGGTLENRVPATTTTTDIPQYTQLLHPLTQPSTHTQASTRTQASTASGSISQISTTSTLKMEYLPRLLLLSGI